MMKTIESTNQKYIFERVLIEAENLQEYLEIGEMNTTKILYLLQNLKFSIWHAEASENRQYQTELYVILKEYRWIINVLEERVVLNKKNYTISSISSTFIAMNEPFAKIIDNM
ncbi:hypothetical protein [Mammaliicoccus sciuri]|uniref:hypothetical protein n=1 Tax=Mammaliicoccus sciuri TaxID=1296 RepID=UPI003F42D5C2